MNKRPADFSYALSKYLASYLPGVQGVSENTVLSYRDTFSLFLIFCNKNRGIAPEQLSFQQIDRPLIEDFLAWLETNRSCSVSTRNQRLAALRAFFGIFKHTILSTCFCVGKLLIFRPKQHGRKRGII